MSTYLLPADLAQRYQRDGFAVLPGFKTAPEIAALRQRAAQIVEAFDPREGQGVFTTHEQSRNTDAYFMASAATISCFFEEEAFDAQGQLKQAKQLSINKIGHALHDLDPVFDAFSHGPELAAVAQAVGLHEPQLWQSMYIFKQPGIGGEVRWHQDASFFDTTPSTVTGFWFALEDASLANGCLWVQPGGHRGPLRERFVRKPAHEGTGAVMQSLDATPWPDSSSAVPLEVAAGTLVVFHGLLPHYSAPNRSAVSRHAYTLHATSASAHYSAHNWLQRPQGPALRGF
jgi:phytanoyl-CoA hydroxylase